MFLVFGWGRKSHSLGAAPMTTCSSCMNVVRRVVVERVGYFSLFFIPVIRRSTFLELCPACHQGHQLESRRAAQLRVAEGRFQATRPAEGLAASQEPEVRQCLQCGLLNDLHAQACSKCGTSMARPALGPALGAGTRPAF